MRLIFAFIFIQMLTYSSRQRTPRNSNKGVQQFRKVNQSLLYFKQFGIIIINDPCILDIYQGGWLLCCPTVNTMTVLSYPHPISSDPSHLRAGMWLFCHWAKHCSPQLINSGFSAVQMQAAGHTGLLFSGFAWLSSGSALLHCKIQSNLPGFIDFQLERAHCAFCGCLHYMVPRFLWIFCYPTNTIQG